MYNSLVLAALLPLSGPMVGERVVLLPTPVRAETSVAETVIDPGDRIPVVPQQRRVAYTPDGEVPQPAWRQQAAVPATPPRTANTTPAVPTTFAPVVSAPRPDVIELRGKLEIPEWNRAIISAPIHAQLMLLKTEQKGLEGRSVAVPLRKGMLVTEGQVLGKFDDRELSWKRQIAEYELKVAKAEAEKKIEVEYAVKSVHTEQAGLAMLKEANSRHEGAVSQMEVLQAELKVEQALAYYELQDYNLKIIKSAEVDARAAQLAMADVLLELRQIVSPISGMIVKIEKAEGEWLREGEPVLEIVQLGTLCVVCKVNANLYDQNSVGGRGVSVTAPLPNGKTEEFPGKVVFVNPIIDSGDTFDVYIEVQNRPYGNSWLLQPGRMVSATIKL